MLLSKEFKYFFYTTAIQYSWLVLLCPVDSTSHVFILQHGRKKQCFSAESWCWRLSSADRPAAIRSHVTRTHTPHDIRTAQDSHSAAEWNDVLLPKQKQTFFLFCAILFPLVSIPDYVFASPMPSDHCAAIVRGTKKGGSGGQES